MVRRVWGVGRCGPGQRAAAAVKAGCELATGVTKRKGRTGENVVVDDDAAFDSGRAAGGDVGASDAGDSAGVGDGVGVVDGVAEIGSAGSVAVGRGQSGRVRRLRQDSSSRRCG